MQPGHTCCHLRCVITTEETVHLLHRTPADTNGLLGGLTRSTRISMFSVCERYAVYVSTIGSCMPSCRLRRLTVPLLVHIDFTETHAQSHPKGNKILISPHFRHSGLHGFLGGLTMTYYVICYWSSCIQMIKRTGHGDCISTCIKYDT